MFNLEEQYPLILLFQKMLKLFRWNCFMHLKYIFRRVSALGLSVFCQNIWTIDQKYSFIFIFHLFIIRPYHTVKHLLQAALFWVWSHLRISWKTKVTTMRCFYIEKNLIFVISACISLKHLLHYSPIKWNRLGISVNLRFIITVLSFFHVFMVFTMCVVKWLKGSEYVNNGIV